MFSSLFKKDEWVSNVRNDILSGLVVALALIPEAIAFSIIAGVDPKIGLYSSFCIAFVTAFLGGRPGMISAATGAMAILMVTLVKTHGLEYLLACTVLTGIFQVMAGYLKLDRFMSFVPRSVMVGFVNALAIIIFMAQLPELINVTWHVYALTLIGLAIIYLFPYIPKIGTLIPSPLVTIILLTIFTLVLDIDVRTIGDMGELPSSLPVFLIPQIPLNFETLAIISPYALSLCIVGLLESLMTASIVDDLTNTTSDKNKECFGQGVANITTGFMGGMAGCAMIGQSIINIKSGGRTRLSTLVAGVFLILMVVFLSDIIKLIPMAALVAIMIMVSIGTFDWLSIKNLKTMPMATNIVMLTTVFITITTHNLALGVIAGILLSSLFFANKISHLMYSKQYYNNDKSEKTYEFFGQIFFNSADKFYKEFDFKEVLDKITIDLSKAHFWDVSAIYALDKVVIKFKRQGTDVKIIGENEASKTMIDKFGVYNKPEEIKRILKG